MAFGHALLGWPPIVAQLRSASVDPDLIAGISVGWHFGSIAMVALGVVVIASAAGVASHASAFRSALTVGASYICFGLGAAVFRSPKPQFLGFIVIGVLIASAAFRARRAPDMNGRTRSSPWIRS
jgi:hypothetical protein